MILIILLYCIWLTASYILLNSLWVKRKLPLYCANDDCKSDYIESWSLGRQGALGLLCQHVTSISSSSDPRYRQVMLGGLSKSCLLVKHAVQKGAAAVPHC